MRSEAVASWRGRKARRKRLLQDGLREIGGSRNFRKREVGTSLAWLATRAGMAAMPQERTNPMRILAHEEALTPRRGSLCEEGRGKQSPLKSVSQSPIKAIPAADFSRRCGSIMKRSNSAELLANAELRVFGDVELADARRDRLPRNSPYVGSFHRGYPASNSSTPTYDVNSWRLPSSCPYVGTLNHAHVARPSKCTSPPRADVDFVDAVLLSGASTPPRRSVSREAKPVSPTAQPHSHSEDTDMEAAEPARSQGRGFANKRRTQSFCDIRDAQCPEVMGMQAILPRRSGTPPPPHPHPHPLYHETALSKPCTLHPAAPPPQGHHRALDIVLL